MNKKKLIKLIKKQDFKLETFKVLPKVIIRVYEKTGVNEECVKEK